MDDQELEAPATLADVIFVILLAMCLTTEIVAAVSPTPAIADQRLTDIANGLDNFAQQTTEARSR